eukprot:363169-Chlamydomonas_euryale.AAC.2
MHAGATKDETRTARHVRIRVHVRTRRCGMRMLPGCTANRHTLHAPVGVCSFLAAHLGTTRALRCMNPHPRCGRMHTRACPSTAAAGTNLGCSASAAAACAAAA